MITGVRCPHCGSADLDVFASRNRIRSELELRQEFFGSRIDGYLNDAQRKDSADVARGDSAEILICRDRKSVV